ncbi:phosphoglycerate mutase family protein [Streptomyces diacarni]|uniref:histidine phosphatase family protein n=1 Tax=Streptomyces diacarni TaxID=2800381 RepID=UPI0033EE174A
MLLALVRHAESVENATKYTGFYRNPRPWNSAAAHDLSRDIVGLTPRGFTQCLWLRETLAHELGAPPQVWTSRYRRARDTAALAFPRCRPQATGLLDEQHYGDATYMTKEELFTAHPGGVEDRRLRKHLWLPPGPGGESLAGGVHRRAATFLHHLTAPPSAAGPVEGPLVAVTHHTTLLALRALLEHRSLPDVVAESRRAKTPNAVVLLYEGAPGHAWQTRRTLTPPSAKEQPQ